MSHGNAYRHYIMHAQGTHPDICNSKGLIINVYFNGLNVYLNRTDPQVY